MVAATLRGKHSPHLQHLLSDTITETALAGQPVVAMAEAVAGSEVATAAALVEAEAAVNKEAVVQHAVSSCDRIDYISNDRADQCGGVGHYSRDCTQRQQKCYNCGEVGHLSRDCPSEQSSERLCYRCKRKYPDAVSSCFRTDLSQNLVISSPLALTLEQHILDLSKTQSISCYPTRQNEMKTWSQVCCTVQKPN